MSRTNVQERALSPSIPSCVCIVCWGGFLLAHSTVNMILVCVCVCVCVCACACGRYYLLKGRELATWIPGWILNTLRCTLPFPLTVVWQAHEWGSNSTLLTYGDSGAYRNRQAWHRVRFPVSLLSWPILLSYT